MKSSSIIIENIQYVRDNDKNELSFETNMTPFERNKFRKILLSDLSVLAVDTVCILNNETIFTNEQVVQRLSLLPIKSIHSSNKDIIRKEKCDCEKSCEKCVLYISFNITTYAGFVYSHDISPLFYPNIIVLPSIKNKANLSVIMKITKKDPKKHYKWSIPVVFCFEGNKIILKSDFSDYDLLKVLLDVLEKFYEKSD